MSRKKNYLNNKDLYNEILLSKEKDKLTPKAIEYLKILAEHANKKLKYRNEQDRDDCIATAIEDVIKYWRSFKPEKTDNAFAYFTQMCKMGYAKGWKKLYPEKYKGTISLNCENENDDGIYSI